MPSTFQADQAAKVFPSAIDELYFKLSVQAHHHHYTYRIQGIPIWLYSSNYIYFGVPVYIEYLREA